MPNDGSSPATCLKCKVIFEDSLLIQAETRHILFTQGYDAAYNWFNNEMEEVHSEHA
jgi:hypothetical protein